jgi:hypothetical protein
MLSFSPCVVQKTNDAALTSHHRANKKAQRIMASAYCKTGKKIVMCRLATPENPFPKPPPLWKIKTA